MPAPQAFLLTWTCYGTWLHGDARGSVDRDHSRIGSPILAPDPDREAHEGAIASFEPLKLSGPMRRVVRDAIIEHAAYEAARLFALNVRTNHVHVVLAAAESEPGRLVGRFKAWCTRRLRAEGLVAPNRRVWTGRSSTRYLWNDEGFAGAVHYVLREQGPPDEFAYPIGR